MLAVLVGLWTTFLTLSVAAQDPMALPDVVAVRVSTTPDRGRLIIDLSGTTQFAIASLDVPNRIVIDVRAEKVSVEAQPPVAGSGIVASYTTVMAAEGRARTEIVLNAPAVVQQAYMLAAIDDQPARLVVDLIQTTEQDFAARVAADRANALGAGASPPPAASSEPSSQPPAEPASEAAAEASAAPPAASTEPSVVAAEPSQEIVVEGKPLIVIDPGHGGNDNGASAPSGIHEKDITLDYALHLRDKLLATGKFDVALTREDDIYLSLNQRVDIARENKADMFISLHADSFQQPDIHGASIYMRDERATDILDAILAAGENRRDIVASYLEPETVPAVADILLDLMRRQVRKQAFIAASAIEKALEPNIAMRRFPVRQADFFVLQAPEVPSLLIELGFMSNALDIKNLEDQGWRDKVLAAIATGVGTYFDDLARAP